ncbi:MAG TPA: archaellin/type IV pilin N-terminal domain-containing protein [Dehalococcoidia bacterium]|nr:archaellin/type IV pilin N-terminal domain-containing protein [Dehalococcoidia bacterium]
MSLRKLIREASRDERGITGLETAIILIAFVVVATVFAFIVLTTGIFSAERGKETVFAGLQKARGTMEVRGGVVVNATTITAGPPEAATAGTIQFSVATTAGGEPVPLDPSATSNRTVIAYRDAAILLDDVPYTATEIVGDGDTLLEPGELFTISVDIADLTGATLNPNDRFTFEIQTPVGAVIDLTRSLPADLDTVMQLH